MFKLQISSEYKLLHSIYLEAIATKVESVIIILFKIAVVARMCSVNKPKMWFPFLEQTENRNGQIVVGWARKWEQWKITNNFANNIRDIW